ncbi:hypothetical protein G6F68_008394 [Rhizopus microsporus]|nr:hypothetical protein G6F67_006947 [Rhizopus microsporus]KAG1259026.1 hypothetical protein G6F68_008394 [Rhizopus microsporus]
MDEDHSLMYHSTPFSQDTCSILLDDVKDTLRQLPPKKTSGSDHIRQEMLAPLQPALAPILLFLFQLLERSIHHFLMGHSPPLGIAQGEFRESRGSLDQALCLAEICNILRRHYRITPLLATHWCTTRVNPLSVLYSIYINEFPRLLRPQPITTDISPAELILRLNCLLYADDVVLIATKADMPILLKSCEDHSYKLRYRWNPSKCVISDPTQPSSSYTLYGETIPKQTSFPYLGIPFRPGSYLDAVALVNQNKAKALATMNQLSTIDVHPKGFSPFLGIRFYGHIVRAQLKYGLATAKITTFLSKQLEDAQNACLRRIFGGSHTSSTTIMLHMSKLPTMQKRAYALQSQFPLRSLTLPEDALLHYLLPFIRQPRSHSQWYKLSRSPIWKRCSPDPKSLDRRSLQLIQREYRQDSLNNKRSTHASVLLMHCRPTISLDPVL